MVGEQGIALEGLHHEEEALPRFVHDLNRITEFEQTRTKLPASRVTQKMETPVIYFHCDQPLKVEVGVWFARGLMTQFYPLPDEVYPLLAEARKARLDMSAVDGSRLCWRIDLEPDSERYAAEIPTVDPEHPWAIARQVRAATVRTRPGSSPARAEAESYLFYRGLGRWQPAVGLQAERSGAVTVANSMQDPIPFVAVLELGEDGGTFVVGEPLAAGARQRFELGGRARERDRERLARQLGAAVLRALVASGLYHDEARAMVATWSRSWFQKDGSRVIYLLPRAQVDEVLPLQLQPPPRELVRTLVGRLEYITPERQAAVEQALRAGADSPAGAATLFALDRFLEPHLRNVACNGSDAEVRVRAELLLAALAR
jgi:hypothetical protein